jgi:hypothetical protein
VDLRDDDVLASAGDVEDNGAGWRPEALGRWHADARGRKCEDARGPHYKMTPPFATQICIAKSLYKCW